MSLEYLNWGFNRRIKPSPAKFILIALCDFADEEGMAYPTIETLANKTGQDRKTAIKNLALLVENNIIVDTTRRIGRTQQTVIYKINMEASIPSYKERDHDHGALVILKSTKNGTVSDNKENQELSDNSIKSTKNGTVPLLDSKSPKNGTPKESQKRDTEPSSINHHEPPLPSQSSGEGDLLFKTPCFFKAEWLELDCIKESFRSILKDEYGVTPMKSHWKLLTSDFIESYCNGVMSASKKKTNWLNTWESKVRKSADIKSPSWLKAQGVKEPVKTEFDAPQNDSDTTPAAKSKSPVDENLNVYIQYLNSSPQMASEFLATLKSMGIFIDTEKMTITYPDKKDAA